MRWLDLAVIAAYLVGITWFGSRFRSSQKSLKDYFLGGKTAPWWAIALSIVSAETSTLTVIGTPPIAFQGNLGFLQLVMGYLLARIVISTLFLPAYFRGELYTAYELMRIRFGPRIRRWTAGLFLVLRALAEGVRVFAISIVISIVLGTGEMTSIAVIVVLTLFYTYEGGMTAVIWTDVAQMFLYVAGAVVSFFAIRPRDSRRMEPRGGFRRAFGQVSGVRFSCRASLFHAALQLLGRNSGRMFPDHGQPRNRTINGAKAARRIE